MAEKRTRLSCNSDFYDTNALGIEIDTYQNSFSFQYSLLFRYLLSTRSLHSRDPWSYRAVNSRLLY